MKHQSPKYWIRLFFEKKHFFLLISICICFSGMAQVIYPSRVCSSPKALKELSGLALVQPNVLAAINDGGNGPVVYFMDTTGKLLRKKVFKGITNTDWEELFFFNKNLYIADVGDNLCRRETLTVFKYDLEKDSIVGKTDFGLKEKNAGALPEKDRHYDCEAGFCMNGIFYFFTKTHAKPYTGISYQYNIRKHLENEQYTRFDSAYFGDKGFIRNSLTGAALSPSTDIEAFISCTHLWLRLFPRKQAYISTGWLMDFEFEGFTQKEAVTFINDDEIVVGDERTFGIMGGRLYFYDIGAYLRGEKQYSRPSVKNAVMKKKISDESNVYDFSFESLEPLSEVTVVWLSEDGTPLIDDDDLQKIKLVENRFHDQIYCMAAKDVSAYWLIGNGKVLLTSKIIRK